MDKTQQTPAFLMKDLCNSGKIEIWNKLIKHIWSVMLTKPLQVNAFHELWVELINILFKYDGKAEKNLILLDLIPSEDISENPVLDNDLVDSLREGSMKPQL